MPLFFIAIAIAEADAGTVSAHAAVQLVLEQIGYGLVGGVVAGALGGARAAVRRAPPADRAALAADPDASRRRCWRPASRARSAAASSSPRSRGGFVFGALAPRHAAARCRYLVDEGGELFNAVTFIVFGAVILGPALDELTWQIVALRRAEPDGRADAAGRARAAGQRRTPSDGRRSWAGSARAGSRRSSSR